MFGEIRVRFGVSVSVRDSFSVFLRARLYSMLTVRHRNLTLYFTGSLGSSFIALLAAVDYWLGIFVCLWVSVFSR